MKRCRRCNYRARTETRLKNISPMPYTEPVYECRDTEKCDTKKKNNKRIQS